MTAGSAVRALVFGGSWFRSLALGAAAMASVALGGCVVEEFNARYPLKSDMKPHPGVESAKRHPVQGIDISRWQGEIDWQQVRAAGTRFAFIKATEGGDHVDPAFLRNWHGARAAGIPAGAYHFVYWCRPAHEQAQWFVQHIPNSRDSLALPPILDVEWNGHSKTCPKKVSRETAIEKMRVMLRELEAHTGRRPIIYTDIPFHRDVIEGTTEFEGYPFWIRSTAARPEERYANRRWEFWQFTTTGRVPGIRGDVDRNAFYGTDQEFQAWVQGRYDIAMRQPNSAGGTMLARTSPPVAAPPAGGGSPVLALQAPLPAGQFQPASALRDVREPKPQPIEETATAE